MKDCLEDHRERIQYNKRLIWKLITLLAQVQLYQIFSNVVRSHYTAISY